LPHIVTQIKSLSCNRHGTGTRPLPSHYERLDRPPGRRSRGPGASHADLGDAQASGPTSAGTRAPSTANPGAARLSSRAHRNARWVDDAAGYSNGVRVPGLPSQVRLPVRGRPVAQGEGTGCARRSRCAAGEPGGGLSQEACIPWRQLILLITQFGQASLSPSSRAGAPSFALLRSPHTAIREQRQSSLLARGC